MAAGKTLVAPEMPNDVILSLAAAGAAARRRVTANPDVQLINGRRRRRFADIVNPPLSRPEEAVIGFGALGVIAGDGAARVDGDGFGRIQILCVQPGDLAARRADEPVGAAAAQIEKARGG